MKKNTKATKKKNTQQAAKKKNTQQAAKTTKKSASAIYYDEKIKTSLTEAKLAYDEICTYCQTHPIDTELQVTHPGTGKQATVKTVVATLATCWKGYTCLFTAYQMPNETITLTGTSTAETTSALSTLSLLDTLEKYFEVFRDQVVTMIHNLRLLQAASVTERKIQLLDELIIWFAGTELNIVETIYFITLLRHACNETMSASPTKKPKMSDSTESPETADDEASPRFTP